MDEKRRSALLACSALLGVLLLPVRGAAATGVVISPSEAARSIAIEDLRVDDDSVSGTIVNRSSAAVRDVGLLLLQVWHWTDDRYPGTDSPGRALPFKFAGEVAANASVPFTFQTPPLPRRSDGRFVTTMDVTGFTEVGR